MVKENVTIAIILLLYVTLIALFGIYFCIRRCLARRLHSLGSDKSSSSPSSPFSSNSYSPPPGRDTRMLTDAPRGGRGGGGALRGGRIGGGRGGQIKCPGGALLLEHPRVVGIQNGVFNVVPDKRVVVNDPILVCRITMDCTCPSGVNVRNEGLNGAPFLSAINGHYTYILITSCNIPRHLAILSIRTF
jgi:hypothetical protein